MWPARAALRAGLADPAITSYSGAAALLVLARAGALILTPYGPVLTGAGLLVSPG